jgi:hypothetical protein
MVNSLFASDVLVLLNQMRFEGEIRKVRKCEVVFSDMKGKRYTIPASDIQEVHFEDPTSTILLEFLEMSEGQADACLSGQMDAENYHGKTGMHVALGILFGPFAVLGAAVSKPIPQNGKDTMALSTNKEMFSDSSYLSCYTKKARGQNVTNTLIGWGAWILFLVII